MQKTDLGTPANIQYRTHYLSSRLKLEEKRYQIYHMESLVTLLIQQPDECIVKVFSASNLSSEIILANGLFIELPFG